MKTCHPASLKKVNVAGLNLFRIQPQNDKRSTGAASLAHLWLPRSAVPGMSLGQGLYLSVLKWRHSVGLSSTWQTAASIVACEGHVLHSLALQVSWIIPCSAMTCQQVGKTPICWSLSQFAVLWSLNRMLHTAVTRRVGVYHTIWNVLSICLFIFFIAPH